MNTPVRLVFFWSNFRNFVAYDFLRLLQFSYHEPRIFDEIKKKLEKNWKVANFEVKNWRKEWGFAPLLSTIFKVEFWIFSIFSIFLHFIDYSGFVMRKLEKSYEIVSHKISKITQKKGNSLYLLFQGYKRELFQKISIWEGIHRREGYFDFRGFSRE